MPRVTVAQLFDDNRERLKLTWAAGKEGAGNELSSELLNASTKGLIDHLNVIHPNWIPVLGAKETEYLARLDPVVARESLQELAASGPLCLLVSDGRTADADLCAMADAHRIPVLLSPIPSIQLMWLLRPYLARLLSEFVTRHGVFLDVLGMGVLITGKAAWARANWRSNSSAAAADWWLTTWSNSTAWDRTSWKADARPCCAISSKCAV